MSRRTLLAAAFAAALGSTALAGDPPQKSCCQEPEKAVTAEKMRCSITGKTVDRCCCVEKDGKTYCTLAAKSVEKCCCTPAEPEAAK